jgi:uncharacterized protein (DUF1684 family)
VTDVLTACYHECRTCPIRDIPSTTLYKLPRSDIPFEVARVDVVEERRVMNLSRWKQRLTMERGQKDTYFALHPQSPLLPVEREAFTGLAYYPSDPDYRFELELHEHTQKKPVQMTYTKGEAKAFLRWGEFRFTIGGEAQVLQVYTSSTHDLAFFVPFRDTTSGTETYGAGRYLDLKPERDLTAEGKWILDFNQAYNPWCAYNAAYTCPFVPPENWLDVPIPAGEKQYSSTRKKSTAL